MQAGRRQLLGLALAAGVAPAFIRHAGAADRGRFDLGVASGQPRADGVVLWTRLTGLGLPERVDVRWEVAHDEGFARVAARGVETAVAADAHSVHAEPAGLDPARWYWYRFEALGARSPAGRTRTAPAADAAVASLELAIASCQRWDHGHYAGWRHAAAEPLDLLLFLGDYIYEHGSPPNALRGHAGGRLRTLDDYRARHAQYKSDAALQAAHAAFPWLLAWDDHEVENDYAGLQGNRLQPEFAVVRGGAYQAYWEHMPLPAAARPTNLAGGGAMRMHGRLDWGRLARLHLLDDRQQRDPQACPRPGEGGSTTVRSKDCAALADPRRTLLGEAQERWLADGWDPARRWNLVGQQTLMARLDVGDAAGAAYWTDGWDGYPAARRRLLGTVAERRVPGVVVFGGDVHANFVADLKADYDDPAAPVVASEFCGTSMTSTSQKQATLDRVLPRNPHLRFGRSEQRGYVRFSVGPAQLKAELRTLADARDPASAVSTAARFVVDPLRPGPQPA